MTTLKKTPPRVAFFGVTLTVLALATGTFLSRPAVADASGPGVQVEPVQVDDGLEQFAEAPTWIC